MSGVVVMHKASWMGEAGIIGFNQPPYRPSVLGRNHTAAVNRNSTEDKLPIQCMAKMRWTA